MNEKMVEITEIEVGDIGTGEVAKAWIKSTAMDTIGTHHRTGRAIKVPETQMHGDVWLGPKRQQ